MSILDQFYELLISQLDASHGRLTTFSRILILLLLLLIRGISMILILLLVLITIHIMCFIIFLVGLLARSRHC